MALSGTLISLGTLIGIYGLLAIGLNIKFGYAGLLDFGHVVFYLVGAYTTALLVAPPAATQPGYPTTVQYILGLNLPWIPALLAATVVTALLGMLVALPAIRLREDYLAITLLGVSAVGLRIFQTEQWLANGPDQLRGYGQPFRDQFPLPSDEISAVLLFGLIVLLFWGIAIYQLSKLAVMQAPISERPLLNGILAILSLGVGYLLAKQVEPEKSTHPVPSVAASLLFSTILAAAITIWYDLGGSMTLRLAIGTLITGVATVAVWQAIQTYGHRVTYALLGGGTYALVGMALVAQGMTEVALGVFLGGISVFSWVYGGLLIAERFDDLGVAEVRLGFGGAVAFLLTLIPGFISILEGAPALLITGVLVILFGYGIYQLSRIWPIAGAEANFMGFLGVLSLWLFIAYYFGQMLFESDPWIAMAENILFLVNIGSDPLFSFNYNRFIFTGVLTALVLCYLLAELAVKSPYGRVLKAIREDEDVAQTLGKNPFFYKVQSMALGSGIAGLAGGIWALNIQSLSYRTGEPRLTFFIFLVVIIGGAANNRGVILGAVLYWAFVRGTNELASLFGTGGSTVQSLRLMLIGVLLILILYYRPDGIWPEQNQQIEVDKA